MSKTVYFDKNDKPRLVPSYCVFADLLGYQQQINDAISKGHEKEAFEKFMAEVEPEIVFNIQPPPEKDSADFPRLWDAKVFTDNVVLGFALWSERGEKEFGHAISPLLRFQYNLALKGYFIRGGWALGNLFMNRNTVFGGALLEAHDLENRVAKYPRIILSSEMKELTLWHMGRYASDPPQCYHLLVDEQGMFFTNYLYESIVDGVVQWNELRRHAEIVSARLSQFESNEAVYPKYLWLAGYHNFFCGLISKGKGYSDDILITIESPRCAIRELKPEDSKYFAENKAARIERDKKLAKLKRRKGGAK